MNKLSRRQFLGKSALGLGSVVFASQIPRELNAIVSPESVKMPLGFQVWTVKDMLIKDFPGTLKMVAGLVIRVLKCVLLRDMKVPDLAL